ncbi:MAG TPA: antibiotic biosynthesis monooxygenase [Acidimicrobiales bacterium]|nr:antibiotic biosynthesis monooxygenase [Acidimicrobiales bacterium]
MSATMEPDGPRIVTVFRSRLRPESGAEYHETAQRMLELARSMPGFVDFKAFVADDGERVSIVTFASMAAHRAWRDHPDHRAAQRKGRERFYASYDISVSEVVGESHFES